MQQFFSKYWEAMRELRRDIFFWILIITVLCGRYSPGKKFIVIIISVLALPLFQVLCEQIVHNFRQGRS